LKAARLAAYTVVTAAIVQGFLNKKNS